MTSDTLVPSLPAMLEVQAPHAAAPAAERCPKCSREARPGESACARCGLLVARFGAFSASGDPPALEQAWRGCCEAWESTSAHDRALTVAVSLECLPALARRYRERLEAGEDAVADKRLGQIAVLIESAIRSQAHQPLKSPVARAVWLLGYLMAGSVLVASAWLCLLAMRHHG